MRKLTILFLLLSILHSGFSQTDACSTGGTGITVGTSCSTSNFNTSGWNDDDWDSAAGCNGSDNDDGWWWFTATSTTTTITYNSSNDAILHVFTGVCPVTAAYTACADNTTSGDETINLTTVIGVTYIVRIQRKASDSNMTGTICVYSASTSTSNDLCADAVPVSCGNSYNGTTVGSTTTGETALPACASTSPTAGGVWYVYTGDGSTVTASLCAGTAYDSKLNVYSGSGCGASLTSCVASNDDGCGTQSTVTFVAVAGTNYYILVNGYSGATGAFTLGITCCTPGVPSCATLNTPANGATGVAQCTSLAWTAPATAGCSSVDSYDVYFGTVNPPPFYANTTSTSMPVSTNPSTLYYWQIRPKNSSGSAAGCTVRSFTSAASGNPQYTMVDDATSPSPYTCVNLTTNTNDQRGCAWDMNSTLNFGANFSYDFTVNLGSSDAGADGMAFVMQNDPQGRCKCGTAGGSLGAGGILNSVVVEIDTYLNYEDRDDFNSGFIGCGGAEDPDHLDIWLGGVINPNLDFDCNTTGGGERPATPTAVRLTNGGSNYNIENGANHILRIAWNAGTSTLTATVMNTALSVSYGTISSTFNPLTVFGTNTPYFGFTASTGGLNNNQSFCNPAALLPVDLMSFNSYCYENYRKIYWSTASENNNAFFTLEKSLDGVHFEVLEVVQTSGIKLSETSYEVLDHDLSSETVYYRLSQTDHNGIVKIFDAIASQCGDKKQQLGIEQLAQQSNELYLEYNSVEDGDHMLAVYDCTGRIVLQRVLSPVKGLNLEKIGLGNISNGVYHIQLLSASQKVTRKFYKE